MFGGFSPLRLFAAALLVTLGCRGAFGEAPVSDTSRASDSSTADRHDIPERWLLVCCGLPGDATHRERLTSSCEKILAAAGPVLGVPSDQVSMLAGDEQMRQTLAVHSENVGVCSSESVAAAVGDLVERAGADDACWVILLGHASFYGGRSQFNVSGPDFDQEQFAQWLSPLSCREQVVWVTLPVSGFWIKPLRASGRVVVTATEADFEITGTEMPYALADVLAGEGAHRTLADIDQDDQLSLLDLYLTTALEIHDRFQAMERLQTEHAQLEDNGDGRGSELQQPYLPPDAEQENGEEEDDEQDRAEAATPQPPEIIRQRNLDGFRSRHIRVNEPAGA